MAGADLTVYNAETYERMWRHAHYQAPDGTPWWPLVRELGAAAPERLEIGPGPWPKMPVAGTHVVDLAESALAVLGERGAIVHRGLLRELAFAPAAFDLVGLFEVLEHVPDDIGLLDEIARITRPGGRLVISVPLDMRRFNAFDRFAGHVRRYQPDELRLKLARAGFEMERFEVRGDPGGRIAALVIATFCRLFPRFSMWVTERVMLPAMARVELVWQEASAWEERARDAAQCTVVARRA